MIDKLTPEMLWGRVNQPEHPVVEAERQHDLDDLAREFARDRQLLEREMAEYDDASLSDREREDMGLPPRLPRKK